MHCILIYCCFSVVFVEKQIINGCYLVFIIVWYQKNTNGCYLFLSWLGRILNFRLNADEKCLGFL